VWYRCKLFYHFLVLNSSSSIVQQFRYRAKSSLGIEMIYALSIRNEKIPTPLLDIKNSLTYQFFYHEGPGLKKGALFSQSEEVKQWGEDAAHSQMPRGMRFHCYKKRIPKRPNRVIFLHCHANIIEPGTAAIRRQPPLLWSQAARIGKLSTPNY